jgi:hypothetical protein
MSPEHVVHDACAWGQVKNVGVPLTLARAGGSCSLLTGRGWWQLVAASCRKVARSAAGRGSCSTRWTIQRVSRFLSCDMVYGHVASFIEWLLNCLLPATTALDPKRMRQGVLFYCR